MQRQLKHAVLVNIIPAKAATGSVNQSTQKHVRSGALRKTVDVSAIKATRGSGLEESGEQAERKSLMRSRPRRRLVGVVSAVVPAVTRPG